MFVFRSTSKERYSKALLHLFNHPERYEVTVYGKDYSADLRNESTGCGWYIQYLKIS